MKIRILVSLCCLLLGLTSSAFGQDEQAQSQAQQVAAFDQSPCSELLRAGIINSFRQEFTNASSSQIQSEICSAYSSYKSDVIKGSVKASYGLFGGSASASREVIEVLGEVMCSSSNGQFYDSSKLSIASNNISEPAINAYRECAALYAAGLRIATKFREDDQGQVTIEITYVAPTGAPASTTISGISISPATSWACAGPLTSLIGLRNGVGTQSVGMSCTRKVSDEPFAYRNGTRAYAEASTITVFTDSGIMNRTFPAILSAQEPPPPSLPIGSIIPFSSSSTADINKMRMAGWWICDGSNVDDPRADVAFRSKATPNLTGKFLRGVATLNQAGISGGSESHKHTYSGRTGYEAEGTWKGPEGADNGSGKNWNHKHDYSGTTSDGSNIPPYFTVVYLIKVR